MNLSIFVLPISLVLFLAGCVPAGECTKEENGDFFSACLTVGDDTGVDSVPHTGDSDSGGETGIDPVDSDGDGHASEATGGDDCDDANVDVYPGADEACNGADDDCDGEADEGLEFTNYFVDADSDGYGAGAAMSACEDPGSGYSTSGDDCDDADATVYPYAVESCTDTVDLNCDGYAGATDNDGDGTIACEDCDDGEPLAFPGNPEVCDDIDNDCNTVVDDDASDASTWYEDSDGDGYGDPDSTELACDEPFGYLDISGDCDDGDAGVNPGETEVCDSDDIDEDCDGSADGEDAVGATVWHRDSDGDGYGDAEDILTQCDAPTGYVTTAAGDEDCDDSDPAVNVAATESCNGIDDDCDDSIDESGAAGESTWYADDDEDGFGDPDVSQDACDQPSKYVADATDCDDTDGDINPNGVETCDGADEDCDGSADNGLTFTDYYDDGDGDGYGDDSGVVVATECEDPGDGYSTSSDDCDDTEASVYPGATEVVSDGIDQDCDGADSTEPDSDGDGEGDSSDCDDADATVYTGATETCDGIDQDCDGSADDGLAFGDWYEDADGDGYGDATIGYSTCDGAPTGTVSDSTDCDDGDAGANPGETESCDGADNDCDGDIDESGATGESTWYADSDGDGYGDLGTTLDACDQPSGYESNSSDCDDGDDEINPDAVEICDSIDNDCDGGTDDELSEVCADSDGDGCGDPTRGTGPIACSSHSMYEGWGYVENCTDPDDYDASDCTP